MMMTLLRNILMLKISKSMPPFGGCLEDLSEAHRCLNLFWLMMVLKSEKKGEG